LAIRRQGIYFAMITPRWRRWSISSHCKRGSPAAGRHPGDPARASLALRLNDTLTMYYFVLAVFLVGFGVIVRRSTRPSAR
jgi:branched-chain amino acid transport system permease protein